MKVKIKFTSPSPIQQKLDSSPTWVQVEDRVLH